MARNLCNSFNSFIDTFKNKVKVNLEEKDMFSQESMRYADSTNIMYRVYAWMSVALAFTAAIAYGVSHSTEALVALSKPAVYFTLLIAQLGAVFALSFFIQRLSFPIAFLIFFAYAALVGLMLAPIFVVYEIGSIYLTFGVTAGTFAAMCLYGYFTKADLTAVGSFAFMALIGLIIGGLVNLYFQSKTANYVLSAIGVLVFTVLTAYDVQKIKNMAQSMLMHQEMVHKVALIGALTLYLDFINLFLYLLQLMGNRRND